MFRIGCVPYLNAKPLIDWFHDASCTVDAEITYAPPAQLAGKLEAGELDTALVSTFELFRAPGFMILPDMSVSAKGKVRSVRLFSNKPFGEIQSAAVDSGSLTSVALTQIVLRDVFAIEPLLVPRPPSVQGMLTECDAGLIIGDLGDLQPEPKHILDLGEQWFNLTGLPFCYAAWICRDSELADGLTSALIEAKNWGVSRAHELANRWAPDFGVSPERAIQYLCETIQFDLEPEHIAGLHEFQYRCVNQKIVPERIPLSFWK